MCLSPCRSPLGLRGLKLLSKINLSVFTLSQPTRAAWIEMKLQQTQLQNANQSQPTRAAWIEIKVC